MKMNWFILALLSMVAFTLMNLLIRKIGNAGIRGETLTAYMFLFGSITMLMLILLTKENLKIQGNMLYLIIFTGILFAVGNLLLVKSVQTSPNPGYSLAVMSMQIMLVTIASFFIFKSDFNIMKIIGTTLALIGIILLGL